jgi:hypothetical protein
VRHLERYLDGQHEQVWTELVGIGPSIRDDPEEWADARAVAEETMRRVRANVARLREGLPAIGYEFANPDGVLVDPTDDVRAELDRLEAATGPIPLAVRVFCEVVGSVDLSGEHPEWPHQLLDPLMFETSVDYWIDSHEDMREQGAITDAEPYELDFSPDDLHKADISGGAPYAVRVPDASADALVVWEPHETTFVNYLRIVLRFAGMGGMGEVRHHGHDLFPTPPEVERLAAELERF